MDKKRKHFEAEVDYVKRAISGKWEALPIAFIIPVSSFMGITLFEEQQVILCKN